jgi:hypothetical protein
MLEIDSVITNGYVAPDTMAWYLERGWTFICTVPAKSAHPHAMDTDKLSIFSKYTESQTDDSKTACNRIF